MALPLTKIEKAYDLLKNYKGNNSYIISLKNTVIAYQTKAMNDFEAKYVLANAETEPIEVNKLVMIAKWYGEELKEKLELEFVPKKLKITWYLGETDGTYHFYCIYRRSQEKAIPLFAPKKAILTDFLSEDWTLKEIDFRPYNERLGFSLYPHQEEAVKFLTSKKKAILADVMGFGKMEAVSSLIPTPNGYKKMGDIKIGDKVFGSDGKEHNVVGVFPHKDKPIYKVTFTDGSFCRCGLEHLWIVRTQNDVRRNKGWRVKSLGEIVESGLEWKNSNVHNYKYEIPVSEPVNYAETNHTIHPYVLGMCIGDGNMCNNGINISIPDSEIESVSRIKSLLNESYTLSENRSASCPRYRIIRNDGKRNNNYIKEIKRLGLNVHGDVKFIPEEYKIDSITNRIELLRGLMDSDGSISKTKNHINFCTNSEQLANDVAELVCSLGGISRVHCYQREKDGKTNNEYQVLIQIKINPFKLSHKAERYKPTFKKYCIRKIQSVEYDGNEDAQCIAVDSSDHSYLTSKFHIVTHNTLSAIVSALEDKYEKILIISPASVKMTWFKELKGLVDEDEITIVEGSNWKENKFTIINYDILKNFYEIPMETVKTSTLEYEDGELKKVVKEKEKVSRKSDIISEAMENSQLFQSKFDLIIIDEAHRLSNTTSGIYKIVSDLVKRSNPIGIYELSGTPITNRPINFYNLLKIIGSQLADDWKYYVENYCDGRFFYNRKERDAHCYIYCKKVNKNSWYELSDDEKKELDEILDKRCKKIWKTEGASNLDELQEAVKSCYIRRDKNDLELPKKTVKVLNYDLTKEERKGYERVWEEYLEAQDGKNKEDLEKYKKITEGIMMRQWLANAMTEKTIDLARKCVDLGHKVVIFCAFDEELNTIKEAFKDICVVHNGKMLTKRKNKSVEEFQNNPNIKVFIGNIQSAGVGLTLVASDVAIFNSFSWVSGDNLQAEDRIHRLNQKKNVTIYYQVFSDTFYKEMFDKVRGKQEIIDNIIVSEKNK